MGLGDSGRGDGAESDTGIRVLVVDDHQGFRRQVRLVLEEAGYVVVGEAGDAATALDLTRRLRPDALVLDIGLPDRDGFHVADVLRAGSSPPAVVLVSVRDEHVYGRRIAESGAAAFVAKADLSAHSLAAALGPARSRRPLP